MPDEPDNLILDILRAMRGVSDDRHAELMRHMTTTNRRLTSIERTLARQRADLTSDAESGIARAAELEERIEALEARFKS